MGNCCSGGDESKKPSAFQVSNDSVQQLPDGGANSTAAFSATMDTMDAAAGGLASASSSVHQQQQELPGSSNNNSANNAANEAELQAVREEQNRLDLIVQMAGRGMVSVRSTRGSTGYYDQGFAAALGQHLEQTMTFPDELPIRLPPVTTKATPTNPTSATATTTNNNASAAGSSTDSPNKQPSSPHTKTSAVFQRLSQPQWDNIALGRKGTGLAGCDGENPNTYLDHVAVSFLDSVVPKKERIFSGGVGPMVENLL